MIVVVSVGLGMAWRVMLMGLMGLRWALGLLNLGEVLDSLEALGLAVEGRS